MKTVTKLFALAAATLVSSHALAADDIKVTKSGIGGGTNPYIGAAVGNSSYDKAGGGDPGLAIFGGLSLNDILSVEGGFINMGEGGSANSKVDTSALYLGLMGNLPLGSEVTGFATVGIANWDFEVNNGAADDSGADVYFGLGINYAISGNAQVRFGVTNYSIGAEINNASVDEDVLVTSIGVAYSL